MEPRGRFDGLKVVQKYGKEFPWAEIFPFSLIVDSGKGRSRLTLDLTLESGAVNPRSILGWRGFGRGQGIKPGESL